MKEITGAQIEYLKDDLRIKDILRQRYYLLDYEKYEKLDLVYRGMLRVIDILKLEDEIGV